MTDLGRFIAAQESVYARVCEEARAYLRHPVLGSRLLECTALVNSVEGRTAREILGTPDDLKFRSCMTLFARAAEGWNTEETPRLAFDAALRKYFAGALDERTLGLLALSPESDNP